ncbi:MAG: hypothetical protein H8E44_46025 [Planctomycetes bacterium]|nr:hypothetical protein [Planctomycetota bacterium]
MFTRLLQIVTSFAAVLGAYLAYSFAAVPFIEPSVKERDDSAIKRDDPPVQPGDDPMARWFPKGSWELDDPTVLETEKGMLLIRDYKQLPDGNLELEPCTVVMQASNDNAEERNSDTGCVLLQAPKAVLDFDGPTNLAQGQFGRLLGGTLVGDVTVRSAEIRPDADDFLFLRTKDVQVTKDGIVAPHQVDFRYGRNFGSGRDLIVKMDPDGDGKETQFGRPKTLELVHVDKIHVRLDAPNELGRAGRKKKPGESQATIDVEVTCDGPFSYDFEQRVARFEGHVEVRSLNPDGPSDQLSCNLLLIYFFDRNEKAKEQLGSDGAKPTDISTLAVERIVAEGSPAMLRAPSYAASATGDRLEFDFRNKRVRFEDHENVMLRYEQNEVVTPAFEYRFGEDDRLGQLQAAGPGVIRGVLPDDPSKTFEAVWQERLILQPDDGDHALSLISGATVRYHGVGEVSANDLHVWLRETPRPSPKGEKTRSYYRPVSMLADGNVRIDSWQLSGGVQKAEVWVRYEDRVASGTTDGTRGDGLQGIFDASQNADRLAQKFDVQAQWLQLQLLRRGRDTDVEHLIINGNVQLREIRTKKPGDVPLQIVGETVQMDYANTPHAHVRVQGTRAEVSARGLAITGDDIQLDRGKNRLWIPGPGKMTLPPRRAGRSGTGSSRLSGSMASPMTVTWKGQMDFDGLVAKFDRDVQVSGLQQTRDGETLDLLVMGHDLDVTMTRRVDFAKETQPDDLDVQQLAFHGNVSLQNHGSRLGARTSYDRMVVRDLSIDARSGDLHASGPGWGSSVRYESSLTGSGIRQLNALADSDDNDLVYVRVDFDDEIVGNIESHDMECRGRVRSVYGPVTAWDQTLDPEPRDGPKKGQLLLTSERLTVAKMGTRADNAEGAIELVADENATIEGNGFTARGWRIKYAKAKDLLILEGDGRSDAELWRTGSTAPAAAAQQILYWTNTNAVQVDGGRELNLLSQPFG